MKTVGSIMCRRMGMLVEAMQERPVNTRDPNQGEEHAVEHGPETVIRPVIEEAE